MKRMDHLTAKFHRLGTSSERAGDLNRKKVPSQLIWSGPPASGQMFAIAYVHGQADIIYMSLLAVVSRVFVSVDFWFHILSDWKAWAHRALIVRKLKGLDDVIGEVLLESLSPPISEYVVAGITVVTPVLTEKGWPFANSAPFPGAEVDKFNGAAYLRDMYLKVEPEYSGRYVDAITLLGFR